MLTSTYKLSMQPGTPPLIVRVSQYDKGESLVFRLTNSATSADISSGVSAEIRGTKPDGNGFSYAATYSYSNSVATVTVTVQEQMTAIAGSVICEIILTKGSGSSEKQLGTANFILEVERAALDKDTVKSASSIRQLINVIDRTDELIAAANKAYNSVSSVNTLANTATNAAQQAIDAKNLAIEAVNDIDNKKAAALLAIEAAKDADVNAIAQVRDLAISALNAVKASANSDIAEAKQDAIDMIEDALQAIVDAMSGLDDQKDSILEELDSKKEEILETKSYAEEYARIAYENSATAIVSAMEALTKASNAENESAELSSALDRLRSFCDELETRLETKFDDAYLIDGYEYFEGDGVVLRGPLGPFIGGGGGGGGGGSTTNAKFEAHNTSGWISKTIASGAECPATFEWSSIEEELPTGKGLMTIATRSGAVRATISIDQGEVEVDLAPYCDQGTTTLRVTIADTYGQNKVFNFTITILELSISSTFDSTKVYGTAISFPYTPVGSIQKTVYFILDDVEIGTATTSVSGRQQSFTIPQQSHGAHTFKCYFEAVVNGETVTSNELYYEIICVEPTVVTPIITSNYRATSVKQFSTVNIDYTVYNPVAMTCEVKIYVDGTLASMQTVDRNPQVFSYRTEEDGILVIEITTGTVGDTDYAIKRFVVTVEETDIDVEPETEALALYLNARGRSNNEENRASWSYNDISATFSGFNWIINGWMQDSEGVTVLRLCDDARVNIPYEIFGTDFKENGKTIEIEFATREVADYSATILSCLAEDDNNKQVGLRITPQAVYFDGHQTSISTLYKENEHVRLAITVGKQSEYRLLLIYINGIMSRAVQYASGERFSQLVPTGITIGSNSCGIDIYNIRVYDQDLSARQVLNNWIADAPTGGEMQDRYTRNNVYNDSGNITMATLPNNLPYMLIEAVELPQYKGDKKTVSGSYTDPVNGAKSFTFEGCQINVQGTSSAIYYRKNYDLQFKEGFKMVATGNTVPNYALRTGSIPFNRFVVKADVASSESANNTGLTMFYNDTCPYKTPEMQEDSRVRWGIEGIPIALFWYNPDNGVTEFMGKYNFNLPKRAPEPLGFSGNMESWEVERNNSANVKFQDVDFTSQTWDEIEQKYYPTWYDDFEARFPSDEWRDTKKLGEFASWVLSTWRAEATNELFDTPITYNVSTTVTLNNYSSDDSYTVTEITEDGARTGYSITFTKDTPAYRLTKFRAELPKYAETSSVVYYYLFTVMFLMIDSWAKNMFVGFNGGNVSESGREMGRKATIQPYDMDTALGTNNSGVLMFGFSLEDTDTVSGIISGEGGGSNAPVFNAQDSVLWCNLRDSYRSEITSMYRDLRASGAWTYSAIESMFENHQSKWPEALFNEDANVKYLVPLVNPVTVDEDTGNLVRTDRYLTMLQGSKAEQRKWWLYNRFRYMDSKYNTGDASRTINMRLFNSGTLTITPAIDLYVGVSFGGGTTPSLKRTTGGESSTFVYTSQSGVQEMETWIYSADLIADVGDLSGFYPNELDFSKATRLRNLKIGDSTAGYSNENLTTLDVRNCGLLESIDLRNCPRLAITVNLEGSPRLKEAYFDNTAVTGVELADGATIETLHLPGTITTLTLLNLNKLEELEIESYSSITRLMLANMDSDLIDPVEVLESIQANSQVNIQGLSLELADADEIEDFLDLLDTMSGVSRERGANGEWMYHDYDTAQVSGTIHTSSLTGAQIASYNARYPYIRVTADHVTSYLKYYNFDGSQLLNTETIYDGADGTYSGTPTRTSTAQYDYTFIGWSTVTDSYTVNPNATKNVVADRDVYAAYSRAVRSYTVTFQNSNGTVIPVNGQNTQSVAYGSNAVTPSDPTHPTDPETYIFVGWEPSPANITGTTTCVAQYADMSADLVKYLNGTLTEYASDTATKVGQYAFYNRTNLTKVETSATEIGQYAFSGCTGLTSVDLTSTSPVAIAAYAFNNCGAITEFFVRSTTLSTLSATSALPNHFIYGNGVIYVPDGLVASYKSATNWTTFKDRIYGISDYPVTDFSTITDSWSEIFANESNGTYSTKYSLGDTKKITINNNDYYAQIVAFDADPLSDNSGNANITWILKELYADKHRMNATSTNANGWPDTEMRTWLNDTILPLIPSDVRTAIKEVTKTSYDKTTSADVTSNDKLWIPSAREVFTSSSNGYESSGPTYTTIFNSASSRIKYKGTSAYSWWLRSAIVTNSWSFKFTNTNGAASTIDASALVDVCLGFCT